MKMWISLNQQQQPQQKQKQYDQQQQHDQQQECFRRIKNATTRKLHTKTKATTAVKAKTISGDRRNFNYSHWSLWSKSSPQIKFSYIALILLLVLLTPLPSYAQQQKFRITPHDLQVLEGSEAMMRCEVTNQAGAVQWTKDGFALGFSAVIPGFPRYSVLGDRKQGVYNLRISNASITDDAEYQCQVGPARLNSAIRANARLTVISPPSSIEIEGYSESSKAEVRENQDLTLKCIAAHAKPAAQIVWYRRGVEYKPDNRIDKVEETSKRFTTTSTLQLKPNADDDYAEYECRAKHKALAPDMPMRATVQLSVLYPPGPPYIEGYTQGETLRRGQTVELWCRSRGGNPPAQLIWYKNGSQIRMAYKTHGRVSENVYTFTAEAGDDKAHFRCEASNVMSHTPLRAEVQLSVLFAPTHVIISGATEARVGNIIPLSCNTAPSNPPAEIKWMVGGRQIRNATSKTAISPEGGWTTSSNISVIIEPNKRSLVVVCHGLNMQLTENVVSTHTINVLYPPSPPIISGYVEGQIIPAGSVQKLLCVSSGGNPLASLVWLKNDKKMSSIIRTADKSVSAEITILANVTDNQAQYRCEASNSATEIPLFEVITLSVHFAPETVKIRLEPEELKPNIEATLICDSSSSNPPATLSWWKNGIPIEGAKNISKPGLWGGIVSTLELKLNMTQDMNGEAYTCQSSNEALQKSIHESINLDVLYRPKFQPPPSSTVVGVEGESLQVTLVVNANPMLIAYTWTKDGVVLPISNANEEHRIYADGANLNFTKLYRQDAGVYNCEATNTQGSANLNITVVVEYGTVIKSVSDNVIVNPGEDAVLSCSVEGKPLTDEHVKWERIGYDMSAKTSTKFVNGTSYLHIKDARRDDVGNFRCIADNRVANPTNRDALLIVKFAPEIDKSPTLLRAASGTGERGRLSCRAQASPKPIFIWRQDNKDLQINRTHKYVVEEKKIDVLTFESVLIIEKVAPADYGAYECVAKNELGQTTEVVRLDITSQPDTPLSLNILNITHDAVTVAWTPGFDGGLKASYRVRYREANREQYKYIDGLPNTHKLTITGLRANTLYLFSVMAFNELGESKYLPDLQRAQTKATPPPSQPASSLGGPPSTNSTPLSNSSGIMLLVAATFGVTIVLLNVFVIGCCLRRRHQRRSKRGYDILTTEISDESQTPNLVIIGISLAAFGFLLVNVALLAWFILHQHHKKAEATNQPGKTASIEMYAPSSYNDTVTGETLSSVSEKSETYSNDGSQQEYVDEARNTAASTYLVESTDMLPPRYQMDGTLAAVYPNNLMMPGNTRTLPHPKHNNNTTNLLHNRSRDDQMLITKGIYIPSPSPAPPMDGSYYNMNSDKYLSYPPLDYSAHLDFNTSTLPLANLQPISQASILGGTAVVGSGCGTLRRGLIHGVVGVPPPDVTHHTTIPSIQSVQISNELKLIPYTQTSCSPNSSTLSMPTTTVKQPQSILKDPNRNKNQQQLQQQQQQQLQQQQLQQQQHQQQLQQQILNTNLIAIPGTAPGNLQILNIPTSVGLSNSLLMTSSTASYDPTNPQGMSTFNTSGSSNNTASYTDANGHLV